MSEGIFDTFLSLKGKGKTENSLRTNDTSLIIDESKDKVTISCDSIHADISHVIETSFKSLEGISNDEMNEISPMTILGEIRRKI